MRDARQFLGCYSLDAPVRSAVSIKRLFGAQQLLYNRKPRDERRSILVRLGQDQQALHDCHQKRRHLLRREVAAELAALHAFGQAILHRRFHAAEELAQAQPKALIARILLRVGQRRREVAERTPGPRRNLRLRLMDPVKELSQALCRGQDRVLQRAKYQRLVFRDAQLQHGNGQIFLGLEVIIEIALCHTARPEDIVHAGRLIPDVIKQVFSALQDFLSATGGARHPWSLPLGWYFALLEPISSNTTIITSLCPPRKGNGNFFWKSFGRSNTYSNCLFLAESIQSIPFQLVFSLPGARRLRAPLRCERRVFVGFRKERTLCTP